MLPCENVTVAVRGAEPVFAVAVTVICVVASDPAPMVGDIVSQLADDVEVQDDAAVPAFTVAE